MLLARSNEKKRASRVLLGVDAGEVLLAINDFFARETTKTTVEMDTFLHFCLIIIDQLEPDIVEEFRSNHKDEVMERFAAFEAKRIEMRQQLEESQQRKQHRPESAPPSPSYPERLSTLSASNIISGKSNGYTRITGLTSYIGKPLRSSGGSKTTIIGTGNDKENRKRYQRVNVLQAHHNLGEYLEKMEEQLEDLESLFLRGKNDEKVVDEKLWGEDSDDDEDRIDEEKLNFEENSEVKGEKLEDEVHGKGGDEKRDDQSTAKDEDNHSDRKRRCMRIWRRHGRNTHTDSR
ncbi:hypothetical protein PsorP6_016681 [Peronosclerospora sorghi]|uniref:Uncharacterized protein n=1 Tax=Peronosclerospora sorghi TaxID=230839 RepID=A0ACC0VMV5_9STRA|nr:hypothetical protein PsorP6_016681 [Peronosclerospora sorghi]